MPFQFALQAQDSRARAGILTTPHGVIHTPVFAPVGTQATVKCLTPRDLHEVGAELILSNTYHLYLRPGADLVERLGGLHRFMSWDGPILTDSGGFQVFSLQEIRKVDDDGVTFKSHLDGSIHRFTPESVIHTEEQLGADIIMVLDECAEPHEYAYNQEALDRTHRWAERCLQAHTRPDQALFAIVQGGIFADLRAQSARFLTSLDFPGYAIGGLSVGESKADMHAMLEVVDPLLPVDKPRYLMGVGSPEDLYEGVARGIDMFDCVLPTRVARNGAALTPQGRINMRNVQWAEDPRPLVEDHACYTCQNFSRAYLRHLLKTDEITGLTLLTLHNVAFMIDQIRSIRQAIFEGRFTEVKEAFLERYQVVSSSGQE